MGDSQAARAFEDALEARSLQSWTDSMLAARIFAVAGARLGGLWLKARAGGVREVFLDHLRCQTDTTAPWTRLPAQVPLAALAGGIDLAASAAGGHLAWRTGLLARANGGILVIPMAERLDPAAAGVIAAAMDTRHCGPAGATDLPARFGVLALDESADGEDPPPSSLTDRLGLMVDLGAVCQHHAEADDTESGRFDLAGLDATELADPILALMSRIAESAGIVSLRVLGHLSLASRILARLEGRSAVSEADAVTALRLCLGIRLLAPAPEQQGQAPAEPEDASEPAPAPESRSEEREQTDEPELDPASLDALTDILAAVEAGSVSGMPLLASNERSQAASRRAGKAGSLVKNSRRGRPVGTAQSPPYSDARQDVVATLRAAAPWQRIRIGIRDTLEAQARLAGHVPAPRPPVMVTSQDFRYRRLSHAAPSTAIFMVDASGSTALERLGETKGAIEMLLAKCYVRRDEVALITFRGKEADIILPPTRSLVSAKRKLAGLPGGGATPLVAGLEKGLELAFSVRRRGSTPVMVIMTDGSGNITRDGTPDRALAAEQLEQMALRYRAEGLKTICIDIARRPRESVTALARSLGADLHLLGRADGQRMSDLVNRSMEAVRP